ncbi:MAG: EAL domain-containing protein [Pseudomonadota bacterium]
MSIAGRLNALLMTSASVLVLLLCVAITQREYASNRDALLLQASSVVAGKPELAVAIHFKNAPQLAVAAEDLLALSPALKRVRLFSNVGDELHRVAAPWAQDALSPSLAELRRNSSPLDEALTRFSSQTTPPGMGAFSVLVPEIELIQTIPIVSLIDPLQDDLKVEDFAISMLDPAAAKSLFVIGYVEIALSRTSVLLEGAPTLAVSAGAGLILLVIFWFVVRTSTRKITEPLGRLARLADDVAAGRQVDPLPISGGGEVRHITEILNGIITGMVRHKQAIEVDRKMLNMKVDRREEQLSLQRKELDEAKEKVSATEDRLRHLAYFDLLTGLPNRRLFSEQLSLLLRLALRHGERLALVILDIDHFKRVNDSLGTEAGDQLLREVALRLEKSLRSSDLAHRSTKKEALMDLSRMGGDEFAVVLNKLSDETAATQVASRILKAMERPFRVGESEVTITVTMGIALTPAHGKNTESLFRAADTAMMSGKKKGRNCIQVYDDGMVTANKERLRLENDLRRAKDRKQLIVHYQPQVNGRTAEVTGAEALVRWSHPDHGLIPPTQWIPIAEELGLINDIGNWVLDQACRDLAELRRSGRELDSISVNISALQLTDNFVDVVAETLKRTRLSANSLQLELTEGLMVGEQKNAVELVKQLKNLGIRLSIDDFGTGYSALSYLTRFPLDELKVDRSFVLGIADSPQNAELVKAILAMGKSLGLAIVVEGVERVEELKFFREHNVDCIQGFLFSPAVPIKKLHELLEPEHFKHSLQLLEEQLKGDSMQIEEA